jgi:hypothetical protein
MDDANIRRLAHEAQQSTNKPLQDLGVLTGARFAAHVRQLQRQLGGRKLTGTRNGLVVPEAGRPYFPGTMAPIVTLSFAKISSGLLVPASVAAGPSPHESLTPYLTADEVLPFDVGASYTLQWLSTVDRASVLIACAQLLARADAIGADWAEITTDLARQGLRDPLATRIENLIKAGNVLFAPQAILVVAKLALQISPPAGGSTDLAPLLTALLALQKDLSVLDETEDSPDVAGDPDHLYREVVRSQSFSFEHEEAVLMARHRLHWHDLPGELASHPEFVDLPRTFAESTGVSLPDLEVLGIALWVRSIKSPGLPIPLSFFDPLAWTPERLAAVLRLITSTLPDLAAQLDAHQREYGVQWSFDPLRRYPVILLDTAGLLVISPALLLERVFGWLPLFDLTESLKVAGNGKLADRSRAFYARVCERETLATLSQIVASPGLAPRLYDDSALRTAFGTRKKTADAAVDCGDTWVVVEVSTRHLQRASVLGGSLQALETDLRYGIDDKVDQIEATIGELRHDESRLTGCPPVKGRKYIPLLVVTEGFPVNPMTSRAISHRLAAKGLLAAPGVAPLRIIDQQDLYLIEHVVEGGRDSLLGLLQGYERGNLREMPFRNWLISERKLDAQRPARLERPFTRAWAPALAALRKTARSHQEPEQEPDAPRNE